MSAEQPHRQAHFARIRRAKWLLRFIPRKAHFHHYPLIGRFANLARRRNYLWSFRTESVRPAIYAGAIIALLPLLGIQVAVAFLFSLLLRANVMVLVGLQFITTPFTAPPVYYGTYHVGRVVIEAAGISAGNETVTTEAALIQELESIDESLTTDQRPWYGRYGITLLALVTGGIIVGTVVGGILDLFWRFARGRTHARRQRRAEQRLHSRSTPPVPPSE